MGVFEMDNFAKGTYAVAEIMAESFPGFTDKLKSLGADIKTET